VNVTNYFVSPPSLPVVKDRIFGRAAPGDPAGTISDYGWPAVATNSAGDIVVCEIRSNSQTYAQPRASVWYAGDSDLSSSTLVQTSNKALVAWHMAGAMADPSTNGIYVSQQYGITNGAYQQIDRIRVAKILGVTRPDIYQDAVDAPSNVTRGTKFDVSITVLNQGDAPMPASTADLRLSSDAIISTTDSLLKQISVPALQPGDAFVIDVLTTVGPRHAPGTYYIGGILDRGAVATEYNESNQNPRIGVLRGNRKVVIN
jgi:hypothetical protein